MSGKGSIRFSELFADTVSAHGAEFGYNYYVLQHGMEYWEFRFWLLATGNVDALAYYLA